MHMRGRRSGVEGPFRPRPAFSIVRAVRALRLRSAIRDLAAEGLDRVSDGDLRDPARRWMTVGEAMELRKALGA